MVLIEAEELDSNLKHLKLFKKLYNHQLLVYMKMPIFVFIMLTELHFLIEILFLQEELEVMPFDFLYPHSFF
jgi:hypothetical protein